MAVKPKLPKLQRDVDFQKYVPRELLQLKFFTPRGFKRQAKSTISREISVDKKDLIPGEIKSLRRLKPKALLRAATGPSVKQRAAIGAGAIVAQEAPILLLLLSKKRKKPDDTKQLLIQTKTEVTLIRKIKEGSLTSKKQIDQIVKQQSAYYQREDTKKETKKPGIVEAIKQKPIASAVTGVSIAAIIALYGPVVWPFVKGFLGELIPGIISQGLKGLSKPVQSFFDLFTSGKVKETFDGVSENFERASNDLSSLLDRINPFKDKMAKQEAVFSKQPSELKDVAREAEIGNIAELRRQIENTDLENEPIKQEIKEPEAPRQEQQKERQQPEQRAAPTKSAEPQKAPEPLPPATPERYPTSAQEGSEARLEPQTPPTPAPRPVPSVTQPAPVEEKPAVVAKPPAAAQQPAIATAPQPQREQQPTPSTIGAVVQTQAGVQLQGLNKSLEERVAAMAADFKQKTGKTLLVTSGVRTNEQQKQLWDAEVAKVGSPELARKKVAEPAPPLGQGRPGLHLRGLAIDINSRGTNGLNVLAGTRENPTGWLEKFGLTRPVPKEDWHIQLASTPPTPDNPDQPGKPLAVPDRDGNATNVTTGEKINGMSADANRLRNEPKQRTHVTVVRTTQTQGLTT